MWETREVTITLRLPHDIAVQAEEVQKTDPEFLSRIALYGLTRRSIYHQLRKNNDDMIRKGIEHVFGEDGVEIKPVSEEDQRAILKEHGAVDGPPQPDIDFCSKCGEHTEFEWDEDDGFLSVCCGTRPHSCE